MNVNSVLTGDNVLYLRTNEKNDSDTKGKLHHAQVQDDEILALGSQYTVAYIRKVVDSKDIGHSDQFLLRVEAEKEAEKQTECGKETASLVEILGQVENGRANLCFYKSDKGLSVVHQRF